MRSEVQHAQTLCVSHIHQAHKTVRQVVVLSSVSEHAHACVVSSELGVEAFTEYAALLQGDVEDSRAAEASLGRSSGDVDGGGETQPPEQALPLNVRVRHAPQHMCVVGDTAFVLPARAAPAATSRCMSGHTRCRFIH
jgi:hypothetical protein